MFTMRKRLPYRKYFEARDRNTSLVEWIYDFSPACRDVDLRYSGHISTADFAHVQRLRGVRSLSLCHWEIDDARARIIATLTELRELTMHCCAITPEVFVQLRTLKNLRVLDLTRNEAFKGSRRFGSGDALHQLVPHLRMFPKLDSLILHEEWIEHGIENLAAACPQLRMIDITSHRPPIFCVGPAYPKVWEAFPQLRKIVDGRHNEGYSRPVEMRLRQKGFLASLCAV